MSDLQDLLDFLKPGGNAQVRVQALDIIEGLTGTAEGCQTLRSQGKELCTNLFRCVTEFNLARTALTALVNLSQDPYISRDLLEAGACNRIMDYIRESVTPHHDMLLMILSNLTLEEAGGKQMLQVGQGARECHNMRILLGLALNPSSSDAMYEHIAGVLCNVTRLPEGRKLLLDEGANAFCKVTDMLNSNSEVKKRGAASTLKNCCAAAERDGTMGTIIGDRDVLAKLLVPLNGEQPLEKDEVVRENLAQCIALIAKTDEGVEALYGVDAQNILKRGFEFEEHPATMEAMEATARLFMKADQGDIAEGGSGEEEDDPNEPVGIIMMG